MRRRAPALSVGSLAKAVWCGLRIGWVRGPAQSTERLARLKALNDLGRPVLVQALAARLGARPLDTEIKALARRARLDLAPHAAATAPAAGASTPADQLGLTPREAEVLALVAAGRSNRQITQALFISTKTASVHVSNAAAPRGGSRGLRRRRQPEEAGRVVVEDGPPLGI